MEAICNTQGGVEGRGAEFSLYTAATPNGWKVSIALEELELPYAVVTVALDRQEQREEWFRRLNPNARIPVLVHHAQSDFVIIESGAILVYLAEFTGRLMPRSLQGRSEVLQWVMFQMGGLGPMMGQANFFLRKCPERVELAIQRYTKETIHLLSVLDARLAEREYLAGEYSIADIANWSWAHLYPVLGLSCDNLPHLKRWVSAVAARAAVQRGKLNRAPRDARGHVVAPLAAGA